MHDALRFKNVSKLPAALKSIALRAARGSLKDVLDTHAQILVLTRASNNAELEFLLPVLYKILDPVGIPDPDRLEAMLLAGNTTTSFEVIAAVDCALRCVAAIAIPPAVEASLDLWPRIWTWFQFIDTHREVLPEAYADHLSCIDFVLFLTKLEYCEQIQSTPGVRSVIARAWRASLGTQGPTVPDVVFHALRTVVCRELQTLDPAPGRFGEYLEGVGGAENLASLVIHHINHFSHSKAAHSVSWLNVGLLFARTALDHESNSSLSVLTTALLSQGLVPAVCDALSTLSGAINPLTTGDCMLILNTAFCTHPGYKHMVDALKAGFLQCLVAYTTALPAYTVYHSVLTEMSSALLAVGDLVAAEAFVKSPIYESWTKFFELVGQRLEVLDAAEPYSILDRWFLRELLHSDYKDRNEEGDLLVTRTIMSVRNPGAYVCTVFDYTEYPTQIWFSPITLLDVGDHGLPHLADYISQALKSNGRMEIHVIKVREGGSDRSLIIPLRSSSSRLNDGLQRILAPFPPKSNARLPKSTVKEIRMLYRETEDSDEEHRIH
ncbi:hypothetical protein C8R44DRAFT_974493 [Mycena epipterygia]|nr:hypothetical protein C8R44DRAFT_974493 [Mycena epipterygia]